MGNKPKNLVIISETSLRPNPSLIFPHLYGRVAANICQLIDSGIKLQDIVIQVREADWEFVLEMWASCYLISQPKPEKLTLAQRVVLWVAELLRVDAKVKREQKTFTPAERAIRRFYDSLKERQVLEVGGYECAVVLVP